MKKQLMMVLLAVLLTMCGCKAPEEAPPEVWLLESQNIYDENGELFGEVRYTYNEEGYLTSSRGGVFFFGELVDQINFTYEYTGEETESGAKVCIETVDYGDVMEGESYESEMVQGTYTVWTFMEYVCAAVKYPEELEGGTILRNSEEAVDFPSQFLYAEYTFDDHGNPVHIVSYGEDLSVLGTVDLTWQLLEYVE